MQKGWMALPGASAVLLAALAAATEGDPTPTHEEVAQIGKAGAARIQRLSTFCLDGQGNLMACDSGDGQIKVLSPSGKLLKTWKPPVSPQAVCLAPGGEVYVGGGNVLARLNGSGETVRKVELPRSGPSGTRIASVSVTAEHVFASMREGTAYVIKRYDRNLGAGMTVVQGLRGCCGRMDLHAHGQVLYVAENARHRVARYDLDGKLLGRWGLRSRKGTEGFGSCCNPMNLCVGPDGMVYTSESGLARIKRHTPEGRLLGVVVVSHGGSQCVNVPLAFDKDGKRIYVADTKNNLIRVLAPKQTPPREERPAGGSQPAQRAAR